MPKTILICIEGVHGIGKSTVCSLLKERGYSVMKENFIPEHTVEQSDVVPVPKPTNLSSNTTLAEYIWIANWFQRALECQGKGDVIVFDRSPYTSLMYKNNDMKKIISSMFSELFSLGYEVHFIRLVPSSTDFLWDRISERLVREPYRERYNEGSRQWLETVNSRYNSRMKDLVKDERLVLVEHRHTTEDVYSSVCTIINSITEDQLK